VSQVPGHSSDWTDHNPHDPGITVLELLAYSILALAFTAVVVTAISRARTRCASNTRPALRSQVRAGRGGVRATR
jgi:hypothetical protein